MTRDLKLIFDLHRHQLENYPKEDLWKIIEHTNDPKADRAEAYHELCSTITECTYKAKRDTIYTAIENQGK